MQTYTYPSPIDGKPITIEKPLLPEHIEVGRLLWYDGFTSTFAWSCPAIITKVFPTKETFILRSLDDMVEQTQEYPYSTDGKWCCDSRKSMRLVEPAVVKKYLEGRKQIFEGSIARSRQALADEERKCEHFNNILATLNI